MSLQKIRNFSLYNCGRFTAKMRFSYFDENGERKDIGESGDIVLGHSRTADLGDFGVPNGAMVLLNVDVDWGKNKQATRAFTYERSSSSTAAYMISGTTLTNELGLIEVRN